MYLVITQQKPRYHLCANFNGVLHIKDIRLSM